MQLCECISADPLVVKGAIVQICNVDESVKAGYHNGYLFEQYDTSDERLSQAGNMLFYIAHEQSF